MKKILVMTDFSKRAEHAAEVALNIAEKTHSDVVLFNAFQIPAIIPAEAGVYPYYEEYPVIEKNTSKKLEDTAERLIKKMKHTHPDSKVQVQVSQSPLAYGSTVIDTIDKRNIWLIVMGDKSREGIINNFIFGSMTSDVIDNAFCPVLLVPEKVPIKGMDKIAFASDLDKSDYKALKMLGDFARVFDSEIIVIHVSPEKLSVSEKVKHMDHFNKLAARIDYLDMTYEDIRDHEIPNALAKFSRIEAIDLLALVHKKYSFLQNLFHSSTTKSMMKYHKIPLMVLPGN